MLSAPRLNRGRYTSMQNMDGICERIKEQRACGRTTCALFRGADIVSRQDRLKRLGYRNIPERLWVTATRDEALNIVTDCLARDLAYDQEVMPADAARQLATAFLANFDDNAQFLTNSRRFLDDSHPGGNYGWEPISQASFDTGVLVEANGVIGIVWVEDED
jgi:hypothetical protein